jgi:hypothetical protein
MTLTFPASGIPMIVTYQQRRSGGPDGSPGLR